MKALIQLLTAPVMGLGFVTGPFTTQGSGSSSSATQATNRTTGVTVNDLFGKITTNTASLAAGASASFTVTNNQVALGDVVVCSIRSGATNKETSVAVTSVAAGSFGLTVHNQHASTAEVGAIIVDFAVIKAVLK
jgi:hypothetical protein